MMSTKDQFGIFICFCILLLKMMLLLWIGVINQVDYTIVAGLIIIGQLAILAVWANRLKRHIYVNRTISIAAVRDGRICEAYDPNDDNIFFLLFGLKGLYLYDGHKVRYIVDDAWWTGASSISGFYGGDISDYVGVRVKKRVFKPTDKKKIDSIITKYLGEMHI